MDNIFIECLRLSIKYEEVYLKSHKTLPEARLALKECFEFYNKERSHKSLDYRTPLEVHFPYNGGRSTEYCGAIFLYFAASWFVVLKIGSTIL